MLSSYFGRKSEDTARALLEEIQKTSGKTEQLTLIAQPKNLQGAIALLLDGQSFYNLCKDPELEDYWQNAWRILGKKIQKFHVNNNTPNFEFKPLNNIHPVDLIRGYALFHNHRLLELSNPKNCSNQLLIFAASLGCIQAQQKLNIMSMSEKNPQLKKVKLENAITATKKLIDVYGSYAAMMLADIYYELQNDDQEAPAKMEEYLKLASALYHISDNAIYNASFGRGLRISNRLEFDEPDEALESLQSMSDIPSSEAVTDPNAFSALVS